MLNRYSQLVVCKEDVRKCVEMFQEFQVDNDERIVNIIKGMILIKKMYADLSDDKNHYYKCMLSDLLMTLKVVPLGSSKFFYIIYRSFIENLVRVLLDYDNNNDTGVRKMFETLEQKNTEYHEYLNGEYGKCCDFVHSNFSVKNSFYEYFEEIIIEDEVEGTSMFYQILVTFFNKYKEYMVSNQVCSIYKVFRGQQEVLNYLLGSSYYFEFKENFKKTENY